MKQLNSTYKHKLLKPFYYQNSMDDDFEEEEMSSSIHDKKDTHIYWTASYIRITKLVVYFPETNDKTDRFFLIL